MGLGNNKGVWKNKLVLNFLVWLKDLTSSDCKTEFYMKNPRGNRLETSGIRKLSRKNVDFSFVEQNMIPNFRRR